MKNQPIQEFSHTLLEALTKELDQIALLHQDIPTRCVTSMKAIQSRLIMLRQRVILGDLSDLDEVQFFKVIKPSFASQHYYFESMLDCKLREPFGDIEKVKQFYQTELISIEMFFREHREFYSYCISDSSQLDKLYFTRIEAQFKIDCDETFCTSKDSLVARLIASKMMKSYLTDQLVKLARPGSTNPFDMVWTGPKTALIELIYSLQTVGVINEGNADVKQIAQLFEQVFNVSLGNYYRVLQDIRLRKNNQTNFLDLLKTKLSQRLDSMD